jgi:hypothetical protein
VENFSFSVESVVKNQRKIFLSWEKNCLGILTHVNNPDAFPQVFHRGKWLKFKPDRAFQCSPLFPQPLLLIDLFKTIFRYRNFSVPALYFLVLVQQVVKLSVPNLKFLDPISAM